MQGKRVGNQVKTLIKGMIGALGCWQQQTKINLLAAANIKQLIIVSIKKMNNVSDELFSFNTIHEQSLQWDSREQIIQNQ